MEDWRAETVKHTKEANWSDMAAVTGIESTLSKLPPQFALNSSKTEVKSVHPAKTLIHAPNLKSKPIISFDHKSNIITRVSKDTRELTFKLVLYVSKHPFGPSTQSTSLFFSTPPPKPFTCHVICASLNVFFMLSGYARISGRRKLNRDMKSKHS